MLEYLNALRPDLFPAPSTVVANENALFSLMLIYVGFDACFCLALPPPSPGMKTTFDEIPLISYFRSFDTY
jgi:hypothetical protein